MSGGIAAAFLLCTAGAAWAHPTGNERRSKEDCERFDKGMTKRKLKACMACVGKGERHFHPQGKAGKRCMADKEKGEKGEKAEEKKEEKKE